MTRQVATFRIRGLLPPPPPPVLPPPPPPDITAPTVNITSPQSGAVVTGTSVMVSGTAADAQSGIDYTEVSLDGQTMARATGVSSWSKQFTNVPPGIRVVTARSRDKAGNWSEIEVQSFRMEASVLPPPPPVLPPPPTGGFVDQYGIVKIRGDGPGAIFVNPGYNRTQNNTRDQFFFEGVTYLAMECTSYCRIDFTADDEFGYKVWGGRHSGSGDNNTTRQGRCYGCGVNKNGTPHIMKEYPYHPDGAYSLEDGHAIFFDPNFTTLGDIQGRMIGQKYLIWLGTWTNGLPAAYMEYYVDTAPFVGGLPQNQWRPFYKCVDHGQWLGEVYTEQQGLKHGGIGYWLIRIDDVGDKTETYGVSCRPILPSVKLKSFTGQW